MKSKKSVCATVFIPTYNGEDYIKQLLKMVFKQKLPRPFEVLVIDSGSTDRTLEIIKKFKEVRLHQITNSEFGHGKTRNLAAQMAEGEFVVYLSQDAVPVHERWLEYMIEPFWISPQIYCVFGKQKPRPFADASTKREVSNVFDDLGNDASVAIHRKKSLVTDYETEPYITFFSDVNSAVRKDYIINKIPYRDVRYSEDQLLGSDVLDKGYLKAYAPAACVWHSNEYKISDYFRRKYDEYMGIYEVLGVTPRFGKKALIKMPVVWTLQDIVFIFKDTDYSLLNKSRNLISSPLRNSLRAYAAFLVSHKKYRTKYGLKHSLEAKNK